MLLMQPQMLGNGNNEATAQDDGTGTTNATPFNPDDRLSKSDYKYLKRKLEIKILRKKNANLDGRKALRKKYKTCYCR